MTPAALTGAWRRASIAIGGAPPTEPAQVVWIQVGDEYVDLRVPHDGGAEPASFAGTTTWQEPHLRWRHEIDLAPDPPEDVGALHWEGDELVETGTFERSGATVGYVERWRREPGGDGEVLALRRADGLGLLVQTGDHALAACDDRPGGGPYRASCWVRRAGTWSASLTLGPGAPPPPLPPPPPPRPGASPWPASLLFDGRRWDVVAAGSGRGTPELTPHLEGARTR